MWRIAAGGMLAGLGPSIASASGVSPYLPLNLSGEIERQIERVLILADKPVMTRPIAAATVLDALPAACEVDATLCEQVRRYLDRYVEPMGIGHAGVEAAAGTGAAIALPNERGKPSDSAWQVAAQGYWQPSAYTIVNVGGVAYEDGTVPSGSMLSLGFEYAQFDVGFRDHWLSPFTQSAMLISTQARTLPSVTVSNYAPIGRLGLQYHIFLAEMGYSNRIRFGNGFTAGKPRLAGMHVAIEPASGWSLGINRIMQFGGGARGGSSVRDFWNALIDPQQYDATLTGSSDNEFGNQAAAWTSRFIFPGRTPFAVYFEYAGEDRAYEGNYRFGQGALSMGLTVPQLWRGLDLTYEISEWQDGWYVHGIYQHGLTNDGHVLGHWGADARLLGNGVGAQSQMLRVGWQPAFGGLLQLRARTVENERYAKAGQAPVDYRRGYDLTVDYSRAVGEFTLGAEAVAGRNVFGESFGRLAAYARFGSEWAGSGEAWPQSRQRPEGAELFVDAGLNANRVLITLNAVSASESGVETDTEIAPHLGIGARRAVSEHNDLGVRAEFDRIDGELLLAVRALDYRFRFKNRLALTAFLGAARYDLATPAFGYYGGFGAQWRDFLPRFDLNLDVRYADKVNRRKTLPDDPPRTVRPDSFYDISSVSAYVSYKW